MKLINIYYLIRVFVFRYVIEKFSSSDEKDTVGIRDTSIDLH